MAVQVLCGDVTHDESNKLRGKLMFINHLLRTAERLQAAQEGR